MDREIWLCKLSHFNECLHLLRCADTIIYPTTRLHVWLWPLLWHYFLRDGWKPALADGNESTKGPLPNPGIPETEIKSGNEKRYHSAINAVYREKCFIIHYNFWITMTIACVSTSSIIEYKSSWNDFEIWMMNSSSNLQRFTFPKNSVFWLCKEHCLYIWYFRMYVAYTIITYQRNTRDLFYEQFVWD